IELQAPIGERLIRPLFGGLTRFMARLAPSSRLEAMQKRIIQAGLTGRVQASDLLGMKGLATIAGIVFGFGVAVRLFPGSGTFGLLACVIIAGAAGYYLPDLWLAGRVTQRREQIHRAMPDAIDLLTISVEAGLGFDAALARVVEKSDNALTRE